MTSCGNATHPRMQPSRLSRKTELSGWALHKKSFSVPSSPVGAVYEGVNELAGACDAPANSFRHCLDQACWDPMCTDDRGRSLSKKA